MFKMFFLTLSKNSLKNTSGTSFIIRKASGSGIYSNESELQKLRQSEWYAALVNKQNFFGNNQFPSQYGIYYGQFFRTK